MFLESTTTIFITVVENEWADELAASFKRSSDGHLQQAQNRELVTKFAKRSLYNIIAYARNIIEAARLQNAHRAVMNSSASSECSSVFNTSHYQTPLQTAPRHAQNSPRRAQASPFFSDLDRTPGAGNSEVARRAITRMRPVRHFNTFASSDKLRRSVLLLANGWPSCISRHATVIETGNMTLGQISQQVGLCSFVIAS